MDHTLQYFEKPVTGRDGAEYIVSLFGRSRPHNTWEGWLVFERRDDGRTFSTGIETTQPNSAAILHWAAGLSDAYFEGALERALREKRTPRPRVMNPPVVSGDVDANTRAARLSRLERDILSLFQARDAERLPMRIVFAELPYSGADLVRAVESLEKQRHAVVRTTDEGTDWLLLTTNRMP